jgi:hypothetical protein
MHKSATKCNETVGKWCKNKHGASKIIDTLETYQPACAKPGLRFRRQASCCCLASKLPDSLPSPPNPHPPTSVSVDHPPPPVLSVCCAPRAPRARTHVPVHIHTHWLRTAYDCARHLAPDATPPLSCHHAHRTEPGTHRSGRARTEPMPFATEPASH